ncbi:hypothetical protein NEUTE1DRAFT_125174 [Neurospora tetrasperma FGSC 2508]|uniref:Glycosyltransferase family 17 protein n=1 Tax=Neurospora tetrasperma (strain FGSC 2508 / ATCC MYA-4615 / P0657) TaxID=510951 RepID=F8MYT0_NEUT8|nr:uncharacterized protein NEUTE1DRAFT_125174 [Neurospora tetrasperma FGSC 2508]EGO51477.1 hypothetical protein NEUTE1DRAFT_125174 [Neurospora tetrasperma FGSC 2508]EGZ78541.1 hypothetical protein NEUTE2DRAFT_154930 [Neurospora tetrasperma FGSC 2509]
MLLQPITNPSKYVRYIVLLLSIWAFIYLFSPFNLRLDKNNPSYDDDNEANKGSSLSRQNICRPYSWKPYQPRQPSDPPRKIYDLVLVTTELDLLEVRLNTTWGAVDYYVLVESAKTFTGRNKPLLLQHALDSSSRFDAYKSKIIYHEAEYPEDFDPRPLTSGKASASASASESVSSSPWQDFHLNAMFDQVFPSLAAEPPTGNPSTHNPSLNSSSSISSRRPQTNDILLLSLASEIPRPQTLALLKECIFPARLTLSSKMHYYSFQFVRRPPWFSRTHEYGPGWTCQFCFPTLTEFLLINDGVNGMDQHHHRLGAGPFGEIDEMERDRIVRYVREGKDLWADVHEQQGGKKWVFEEVVNNTDVPSFLLESPEGKEGGRLRFLMERGGRSGGFRDYYL